MFRSKSSLECSASFYAVFYEIKIALSLPRLPVQRGKAGKSGSSDPENSGEEITAFVAIFERKKFRPARRDKSIKCSLDFLVTF